MEFKLNAALAGVYAQVILNALSETRIFGFNGVLLVFSASIIVNTFEMGYHFSSFVVGPNQGSYDLVSMAFNYGPPFSSKCVLGINRVKMDGFDDPDSFFIFTTNNNFKGLQFNNYYLTPELRYLFFCFGNGT